MSKRYGRNQKRKQREEIKRLEHVAREHYEGKVEAIIEGKKLRKEVDLLSQELMDIVSRNLKPKTELLGDVAKGGTTIISSRLTFTKPNPEMRYNLERARMQMLTGPKAVEALGMTIGMELARALAREYAHD